MAFTASRVGHFGHQCLTGERLVFALFFFLIPPCRSLPPQTDYFHLFLCVAIIFLYGEDVTEQQLATDQMLLHFSNLSMHMNGELVLRKVKKKEKKKHVCASGQRPRRRALQQAEATVRRSPRP